MRKRRLVWVGIVVVLALTVYLVAWLLVARPGTVRLANHWHLKGGMTCAEVEATLGGPPGDYSSPGPRRFNMMKLTHDRQKAWVTDEGMVIVSFDEDGRYDGGSFIGPGVRTPAPLDRLRLWLRW